MVSSSVAEQTIVPHWEWYTREDLSYLTCSLLQNWQHGFFTQCFYPQTPEQLIAQLDPQAAVYRVKQVHGNRILTPSEIKTSQTTLQNSFPDGDGLITDAVNQSVWIASADCNPVLIGDVQSGRVAAVHAGWRGTAKKIVPQAISRFVAAGSLLENLRIVMGPAISGEMYQVTEEVATEVGMSVISATEASNQAEILFALQELSNSPVLEDETPGRVRLDVRQVNRIQVEQLGISATQIGIAPFCTFQKADLFFSYRRTQEKKVQWSGIVSHRLLCCQTK